MGHDAEGLPGTEGRDDLDHDRQPDQHPVEREFSIRGRDVAGGEAPWKSHRRRQLRRVQEDDGGRAAGVAAVHQLGDQSQRAAQWSIATGYVAVRPDAWETETMRKYVADVPGALVARDQLEFSVAKGPRRTRTSA